MRLLCSKRGSGGDIGPVVIKKGASADGRRPGSPLGAPASLKKELSPTDTTALPRQRERCRKTGSMPRKKGGMASRKGSGGLGAGAGETKIRAWGSPDYRKGMRWSITTGE